jgi:hypothetical protein
LERTVAIVQTCNERGPLPRLIPPVLSSDPRLEVRETVGRVWRLCFLALTCRVGRGCS